MVQNSIARARAAKALRKEKDKAEQMLATLLRPEEDIAAAVAAAPSTAKIESAEA